MQKNIFITGEPKSGKSTLLQNLITNIPNKVGFVTNEIRDDNGRIGFEIKTHTGKKTVLAHIDFKTEQKVSKYFVNTEHLESLIPEVSDFGNTNFLYLDEVGEMQLFSNKFKNLVLQYLNSPNTCLAAISYVFHNDFTESIKERDDVILVKISTENREEQEKFLSQLLKKIEKAKRYISEPERFKIGDSKIELKSEHSTRNLVLENKKWKCDCDFFKQYKICSHVIATKETTK